MSTAVSPTAASLVDPGNMDPVDCCEKNETKSCRREITLDLLRKRSEHNENLVSTLEELALHQEELEAIGPVLGRTCGKTLRILLLQNNVISLMDFAELRFFKKLEYINLALNNIQRVEGLGRCECLRKLDLTLNFIDLEDIERSVDELSNVHSLKELYLMGNPCWCGDEMPAAGAIGGDGGGSDHKQKGKQSKGWSGCRPYVIARLPQLENLDGKEVVRSERIAARQRLSTLTAELRELAASRRKEKAKGKALSTTNASSERHIDAEEVAIGASNNVGEGNNREEEAPIGDQELTEHSPSVRARISREMAAQREAKAAKERANQPRHRGEKEFEEEQRETVERSQEREAKAEERGEIRQCNDGKLAFSFDESTIPGSVILSVAVQKYLSTSLIDVDVHPSYISIVIKSKVLRLSLPAEVKSEEAKAERSAATGKLVVTMPKMDPEENMLAVRAADRARERERDACRAGTEGGEIGAPSKGGRTGLASDMLRDASAAAAGTKLKGAVRIDGLVRGKEVGESQSRNGVNLDMRAVSSRRKDAQDPTIDSDDDEPPPLL